MRIILFTSNDKWSGGARQAFYLAQGLARNGHDVRFFVPENCELVRLDPDFSWRFLPADRKLWRGVLESDVLSGGPCVVHAFHNRAVKRLSWWGLFWHRRGAVATLGNRGVCHRPGNLLPYWSPGIDCFTVNSRACADILARVGVSRSRLAVVHNGVPRERVVPRRSPDEVRAELDLKPSHTVFGSVLNNAPDKGLDVLLRAFARMGNPAQTRLVVVGARPPLWQGLLDELGIADAVRLVPYSNHVADYLQVCDTFVLPSRGRQDSMPNTLIEALMAGLPVVATSVGGVAEVLSEDEAEVVPPDDPEALARAMRRMLDDPELRAARREASLAASRIFSLDVKVDRVQNLYSLLLKRRTAPGTQGNGGSGRNGGGRS